MSFDECRIKTKQIRMQPAAACKVLALRWEMEGIDICLLEAFQAHDCDPTKFKVEGLKTLLSTHRANRNTLERIYARAGDSRTHEDLRRMAFDQIWDHELPMFASLFEEELKSVVAHARRYGVGTAASSRRQRHLRDRLQNQLNYGRSPESFSHHRDADGDNSSLYSGATERSEIIRQQRDEAADKQEKKQLREIRMDRFLNSIPQPGNEMVENEQTQKVDFGKKSIIPPPIHVFKNSYKLTTQKNRLLKREKFVNRKIYNLKHALEKAEHTKRFVESQKIHTCKLIDKVEDVKDDLILPPPLPLPPKRAVWKIIPKGSAKELEPIETFEDFLQV